MNNQPTGAPRSWSNETAFTQVSHEAVREVGLIDAYVFARIKFRSQNIGGWRVTTGQMADEIGLPLPTLRKALTRLREGGYIESERTTAYDATLTWRPVWNDRPKGLSEVTGEVISGSPKGSGAAPDGSSPPIEKLKKTPEDNSGNGSAAATMDGLLDRLLLSDFDATSVVATIRAERPDVTHPVAFVEHLIDHYGEHAARGFLEGVGVA